MNEHLMEALRRLRRSSTDTNVDRRLVTNVLLSYLTTPRGDSKRYEMLQLLASILQWNDDEREKAGLQRKGGPSPGTAATGSSIWGRATGKGKAPEQLEKTDETEVRPSSSGYFNSLPSSPVTTVVFAPMGRIPPHRSSIRRGRNAFITTLTKRTSKQLTSTNADEELVKRLTSLSLAQLAERRTQTAVVQLEPECHVELAESIARAAARAQGQGARHGVSPRRRTGGRVPLSLSLAAFILLYYLTRGHFAFLPYAFYSDSERMNGGVANKAGDVLKKTRGIIL